MTLINIKTKHIGSMFITDSYQMFQKLCKPLVCTQKKKDKFRTVFQNILFVSQFMNCVITARGKSKIETTGVSVK